jgi:hypothetical protein
MYTIRISTSGLYLNLILPPGADVYSDYNQTVAFFFEQDSQEMLLIYRRLGKHPSVSSRDQLVRVPQNFRR